MKEQKCPSLAGGENVIHLERRSGQICKKGGGIRGRYVEEGKSQTGEVTSLDLPVAERGGK